MVLKNAKKTKGKVSDQQLIPLIESAGNIYVNGQGKNSSLYKYFTKKTTTYNEKSTTPIVMKNFTAFVFNPNDIERLQKYIEEKNIDNSNLAYAFFGAYNGFASLSKNFIESATKDKELQKRMDSYLEKTLSIVKNINIFEENIFEENIKTEKELTYKEIMKYSQNTFFSEVHEYKYSDDTTEIIDLLELKSKILLKSKDGKIIKPKLQNEFIKSLDDSLSEVEIILHSTPIEGQLHFTIKRLIVLLTTKYKIKGLGEQTLKKLLSSLNE